MKKYLYLLLAFVAASAVMMLFEFTNSKLFPFPLELDTNDLEAVRAYSATMPDTVMSMVFLGWLFGTVLATWILLKYTRDVTLAYIHAGILTVLALGNNYLFIPAKVWVQIVTLPFFFIVVWVVHRYYKR
jgi:hypothetical protein